MFLYSTLGKPQESIKYPRGKWYNHILGVYARMIQMYTHSLSHTKISEE